MNLLWLCSFVLISGVFTQEWIDPHDMNPESGRNLKRSSSSGSSVDYEAKDNLNSEGNTSLMYLKRFVNLLLTSSKIDKSDPLKFHGKLHFSLDAEDFRFLEDFSNNKNVDLNSVRKLDAVLSEMFHKTYIDNISDTVLSTQEIIINFLFSENSLPLLGLCVCLYIGYNLFKSNFSVWYILRYFIFVVIIIDFAQRYQHLYKEVEQHNMNVEYTAKCDTNKMNWKEYFTFMTGKQDCEKKIASLLEVGLLQVKSLIIVPISALGTGTGHFAAELWNQLPFPWNFIIFPVMLIFCAIVIAIVMTVMKDTPFKINLMHMFHLEFGNKNRGISVDKVLNALTHRNMVEDVSKKKNEKRPPKKQSPPKTIEDKPEEKKKDQAPVEKPKKQKPAKSEQENVDVSKKDCTAELLQ